MSEKGRQDMRIGTIRGCEIRVHPLLPLVVVAAAAFGMLKPLCLGFIAVLLHELSHVLAALACGFHINSIELLPFGGVARIEGLFEHNPGAEVLIALAGPLSNLVVVMVLTTLEHYFAFAVYEQEAFIRINLYLALFNLLPALPLDGGRVLRAMVARFCGLKVGTRASAVVGMLLGLALMGLTVWGAMQEVYNPTAGLCGLFLLLAAGKEWKTAPFMLLREVTQKKDTMLREETMQVRQIMARDNLPLGHLVRRFVPYRYHLVLVVDEGYNPLGTVSETTVVEALLARGSMAAVGSLLPRAGRLTPDAQDDKV